MIIFEADYIKIDEYAKRMSIHPRTAYRRFHKKSIEDFVSIITSFCARIYGNRRVKRKTEKIIKELRDESNEGS